MPLWVLVNYLTIGNISYLFDALKMSDQNKIALWYSDKFNLTKNSDWSNIRVTAEYLSGILKSVNLLRNTCAHGERLYCFKVSSIRNRSIFSYYYEQTGIDYSKYSEKKLFVQLVLLRAFFNKEQCKHLFEEIIAFVENYCADIESTRTHFILDEMVFIGNWKTDLLALI